MKPEDFIGKEVEYDQYGGTYIWGNDGKDNLQMIIDVRLRGWGAIQHLFKTEEEAEKFQDEVGEWIADAINQKLKKS
jgi:hypothetical protein